MTEFYHVPFDYEVVRPGPEGRAGRPVLRRATAAIEIATVRGADLPVAYRVKDEREMGRGWHLILRHGGKLWWPLVDITSFPLETRMAHDFLCDLRAGRCDLFVQRDLDDHRVDRRFKGLPVRDGRIAALAAVHLNAQNLLIVDDCLYAAGGVPLLVEGYGVASAGADRAVAAAAGALRIRPANGHRRSADLAICGRRIYVPGSVELAVAMRRRLSYFRGARIEVVSGDAVDQVVVRLDAAFRTAWRAMNMSIPRTRPDGFAALHGLFADACGPGDDDRLTAARAAALRGFVALFETARPRPVAVSKCFFNVQCTLSEVEALGLLTAPLPPLTESDEAAIASLYV
jgi:hypothetical protein